VQPSRATGAGQQGVAWGQLLQPGRRLEKRSCRAARGVAGCGQLRQLSPLRIFLSELPLCLETGLSPSPLGKALLLAPRGQEAAHSLPTTQLHTYAAHVPAGTAAPRTPNRASSLSRCWHPCLPSESSCERRDINDAAF